MDQKVKDAQLLIINEVEKVLKALESHFENIGGVTQTIPVSMIKASHEAFLKSYKEAAEKPLEELLKEGSAEANDDLGK